MKTTYNYIEEFDCQQMLDFSISMQPHDQAYFTENFCCNCRLQKQAFIFWGLSLVQQKLRTVLSFKPLG